MKNIISNLYEGLNYFDHNYGDKIKGKIFLLYLKKGKEAQLI